MSDERIEGSNHNIAAFLFYYMNGTLLYDYPQRWEDFPLLSIRKVNVPLPCRCYT